jgi:hypothetical protein
LARLKNLTHLEKLNVSYKPALTSTFASSTELPTFLENLHHTTGESTMASRCRVRRHQASLHVELLEDRLVPSSSAYVNSLYLNLLHRSGSPQDVAFWVNVLNTTGSPALVADGFVSSFEFQSNIVRFNYQALLHRVASAPEVTFWVSELQLGLSEDQMEAAFLASDEFFVQNGSNGISWLAAANNAVLGQGLSMNVLLSMGPAMASPFARSQFALALVTSSAAHSRVVSTDYQILLLRLPDPAGLANWTNLLDAGVNPSQVLVGIVSSPEYIALNSQGGLDFQPVFFVALPPTATLSTSSVTVTPTVMTNAQGFPFVFTPFTFNPVLGTSLGGNNLFQAFAIA